MHIVKCDEDQYAHSRGCKQTEQQVAKQCQLNLS